MDKNTNDVIMLAIESSCDETAAAVVKNGREVLSNAIYSQIDLHTLYGGVVPEIASRKHIEKINQVIKKALADASCTLEDITAIAVTYGPGLVGALLVGVAEAKAIAFAAQKPLVGVHHIEGHICANYIENKDLEPPFLCLVVSGGHSHLVMVKEKQGMMRRERRLTRLPVRSDWDIREARRSTGYPMKETRKRLHFRVPKLRTMCMISASAV